MYFFYREIKLIVFPLSQNVSDWKQTVLIDSFILEIFKTIFKFLKLKKNNTNRRTRSHQQSLYGRGSRQLAYQYYQNTPVHPVSQELWKLLKARGATSRRRGILFG